MSRVKKPRVLLICGSLNQTSQLHQVAVELPDFICSFTPFYAVGPVEWLRRLGGVEATILGEKLRRRCLSYLHEHRLRVDLGGTAASYDLVVTCTDLFVPSNIRRRPLVVVQEGMTDPAGRWARLVRRSRLLPLWLAGTALTATSGHYDRFCVASEGYRELFIQRGAPAHKLRVTGIPNFDDCIRYRNNTHAARHYVLACTSDLREVMRPDDRAGFIRRVREVAAGRPIHFKLHPNENVARARREIARYCPGAVVHAEGSAETLVANCDVLFTQYSSVAYVGLALGKEVHSYYELDELERLLPIQNGGRSAANIADVCRTLLGVAPALPVSEATHTPMGADG